MNLTVVIGIMTTIQDDEKLLNDIIKKLPLEDKSKYNPPVIHISILELEQYLKKNQPDKTLADSVIFESYCILKTRMIESEAVGIHKFQREDLFKDIEESISVVRKPTRRSPPRTHIVSSSEEKKQVFFDPALRSVFGHKQTYHLAKSQTLAARTCLYWPSKGLNLELQTAAEELINFINYLNHPALVIGLCARIFGPEGLYPDAKFIEASHKFPGIYEENPTPKEAADQAELSKYCRESLIKLLESIANPQNIDSLNPELGLNRAITIAIMGDIGAFMTATGATTGTERPDWISLKLKECFISFALELEGKPLNKENKKLVTTSVDWAKSLGGGDTVAPNKKTERLRVDEIHTPRTGIHDTGLEIDNELGLFGKKGILTPSTWATARLEGSRLHLECIEPFAGHMSASPSEILWTWDILAKRGIENAYCNDKDDFSADRAAGASAFLVANGYHSALEVIHGILIYVGQMPNSEILKEAADMQSSKFFKSTEKPDIGPLFQAGAATELMIELFEHATASSKIEEQQQKSKFLRP